MFLLRWVLLCACLWRARAAAAGLSCHEVCELGTCAGKSYAGCGVLCDNKGNSDASATCARASFTQGSIVECDAGACPKASFENVNVTCDVENQVGSCASSSFQSSVATCRENGCGSSNFERSTAMCGAKACRSSNFERSTAMCGAKACGSSFFNLTTVDCKWQACQSSDFYTSAVKCDGGNSWTCYGSRFYRGSCCDGSQCPNDVPSCTENPEELCSSTYLGKTLKDWGNPACKDVKVDTSKSTNVLVCTGPDCVNSKFSKSGVLCDNKGNSHTSATCARASFTDSIIECDAGACTKASFENVNVTCDVENQVGSCASSSFQSSVATCRENGCGSSNFERSMAMCGAKACGSSFFNLTVVDCKWQACQSSDFYTSAVKCDGGNSWTCYGSRFYRCSCCDGSQCPDDVPSCSCCDGPQCPAGAPSCTNWNDFCSTTFAGRTCAEWGNPLCSGTFSAGISAPLSLASSTISSSETVPAKGSVSIPTSTTTPPNDVSENSDQGFLIASNTSADVFSSSLSDSREGISTTPNTPVDVTLSPGDIGLASDKLDPASFDVAVWPSNGGVVIRDDGIITYIPSPEYTGDDSFTVFCCDVDGECGSVTINVEVTSLVQNLSNGCQSHSVLFLSVSSWIASCIMFSVVVM